MADSTQLASPIVLKTFKLNEKSSNIGPHLAIFSTFIFLMQSINYTRIQNPSCLMIIYDSIIDGKLQKFLAAAPSHKLVVAEAREDCVESKALDLGATLAPAISSMSRKNEMMFQFGVEDAVNKAIKNAIFEDEYFGPAVVLSNPGILFEKALHIDVCSMLKRISKNTVVILLWPGVIKTDRICFLSETSDLYINQSDINYFVI